MPESLVAKWQIHDGLNPYLLEALGDEDREVRPSGMARAIGEHFAHIYNVRLTWLKSAVLQLFGSLTKLEGDGPTVMAVIIASIFASGVAVARLIEHAIAIGGRGKGFNPHVTTFVGYLVSHESHHRGQVASSLRAVGRPIDKKVSYGFWEWGVR